MTRPGRLRVTADPTTCAVSSLCVYRVGAVFDQDEEGHVVVLDGTPPEELHAAVRAAARSCPTRSIRVLEEDAVAVPAPEEGGYATAH